MAPRKETRWDLIGLGALGALGGAYQARVGEQAAGAIQRSGIAASIDMARQAKRVEAMLPAIKLQAEQTHNEILRSFVDWASMANATASYMGRDDRSVDAIRKRVQQDTARDVSRAKTQQVMSEAQTMREAASLTSNAINERLGAEAQAKIQRAQTRANTYSTTFSLLERALR